jgi:high-affinity nickel-transport protein
MITAASILLFGFLFGMRHATDADHVVAVSTIVSREREVGKAAWIGGVWGVGHTLTLALLGGFIVWSGVHLPERLGQSFEFAVALMLIALGLWNLREFVGRASTLSNSSLPSAAPVPRSVLWSLGVGMVHGIAGSGALALLVLPLVRDPLVATAYLLVFGMGTIAGMIAITMLLALPVTWAAALSATVHRRIRLGAGFASLVLGLVMAGQIAIGQGLLMR